MVEPIVIASDTDGEEAEGKTKPIVITSDTDGEDVEGKTNERSAVATKTSTATTTTTTATTTTTTTATTTSTGKLTNQWWIDDAQPTKRSSTAEADARPTKRSSTAGAQGHAPNDEFLREFRDRSLFYLDLEKKRCWHWNRQLKNIENHVQLVLGIVYHVLKHM